MKFITAFGDETRRYDNDSGHIKPRQNCEYFNISFVFKSSKGKITVILNRTYPELSVAIATLVVSNIIIFRLIELFESIA